MKRPPKDEYDAWEDDRDQQDEVYDEVEESIYHRIRQEEMDEDVPFWEKNQERNEQGFYEDDRQWKSDRDRYREERDTPHRADDRGDNRTPRSRPSRPNDREDTYRFSQAPGAARKPPAGSYKGRTSGKKRRKRKKLRILLIVLLILAALAFAVHGVFVRPPKLPTETQSQSQGTHPDSLGMNRKQDVYTFLLVGRDDGGGGNTDTIMVGSYDVKNRTIDVLSIYRDTMVDASWDIPKINSVYNRQGLEGLQKHVKNLIGYVPDYYFVVELSMIPSLVDAMGGVSYDVPYNMDYDDPTQDLHIHFQKGTQHLSGEDAVKLLRWRKNNSGESISVGDIGRVEVQHSFLAAMAKQMLSLGTITRLTDIIKTVDQNLTSNLNYGEMIWFAEQALGVKGDSIRFHNLPGDSTGTKWSKTYKNYQSYVFVNDQALLKLINERMNPYTSDITKDMQHIVHATTVDNTSGPTAPAAD